MSLYNIQNKKINIDFALRDKEVNEVLEIKGLSKSFDNKMLFKNLDLNVEYGDKLATWVAPFIFDSVPYYQ
ncbi:hypothetical protein [Clostridium sp. CF012]|uniref:hypothetical protein n=1 Tax=Clostridium sp. CF012 TaxID=2843319 RepID=UPI001C0C4BE6|nr:hypothetical protein [Clostridium sp. CF012]MBU3144670.1 hypothetical protein [Clostridium sp. CF012]